MTSRTETDPSDHARGTTGDATMQPLIEQRSAGVCMHFTSLPGPHGIGEIGQDAKHFIDALASAGLRVWQFLPTGPTAYGDSPYQPLSTYAGNPMLIEMRELLALGLIDAGDLDVLGQLPANQVSYEQLIPAKTALLSKAAARFKAAPTQELKTAFDQFVEATDDIWLADYALFRTLKSAHNNRPWSEWPRQYRQRDRTALASFAQNNAEALFAIRFSEFMFDRQWRALRAHARRAGVRLFGDMPIYIALDSADAWANGELLRLDHDGRPTAVAGVPPDYFSADGQLWGNPLYDWHYHHQSGFRWWIDRMRHTISQVDIVRIDHFRGFEAYWAVPSGAETARDGAWETGPNDAIFDAMREALGDMPIVAEDLGEITPAVDALRIRHNMPGMSVLQFMVGEHHFDAEDIAQDTVCYTGTHDNDTTVGWYRGGPGDMRSRDEIAAVQHNVGRHIGADSSNIHWSLIETAYASKACMAIAPMQDYLGLGSEARLNTPGKPANNWRWRMSAGDFGTSLQDRIASLAMTHGR